MTNQQTQTGGWQRTFNAALLMTTYLLGSTTKKFNNNVAYIGGGTITVLAGLTMLQPVSATSTVNLQSGLVAYYPFNGNANDESGNGHNGIIMGDTTLTADRFGRANKAYHFDGASSYIKIPSTPDLLPTYVTISAWARNVNVGSNWVQIVAATESADRYMIGWRDYKILGCAPNCAVDADIIYSSLITDNNWHHIVLAYGADNQNLYVDGVLSSSHTATGPITGYNSKWIGIGAEDDVQQGNPTCCYFNGDITEVHIYNRSLNLAEVVALYNEGSSPTNTPTHTATITGTQTITTSLTFTSTGSVTTTETGSTTISTTPTELSCKLINEVKQACHAICIADGICNSTNNLQNHRAKLSTLATKNPQESSVSPVSPVEQPKKPNFSTTQNKNSTDSNINTIISGLAGLTLGGVGGAMLTAYLYRKKQQEQQIQSTLEAGTELGLITENESRPASPSRRRFAM